MLNKIIRILAEINGRDKVFKFIQYLCKILRWALRSRRFAVLLRLLSRKSNAGALSKDVEKRLEILENSMMDARIVYRLGGFLVEYKNTIEFLRSNKHNLVPPYLSRLLFKSEQRAEEIAEHRPWTQLKLRVLTGFDLVDQIFSFFSECADVIFWGTRIELFKFDFSPFYKTSDFIWVYSLTVFMIKMFIELAKTLVRIGHLRRQSQDSIDSNEKDKIDQEITELIGSRNNSMKSILHGIGEFGICICSVYEIDNPLLLGVSGCLSAIISLQEIWIDTEEKENEDKEEKENPEEGGEEKEHHYHQYNHHHHEPLIEPPCIQKK